MIKESYTFTLDTKRASFIFTILFSIIGGLALTEDKETLSNSTEPEIFCSIIYPSEKFYNMLDLNNDPECDKLETGVVRFNSHEHTIIGYYIEPTPSKHDKTKLILKISTVAYNQESDKEEIVDIARLGNTAISRSTFSDYIVDWRNSDEAHRVDKFETLVNNYGFTRTQIQYMDSEFVKSFISAHDLRLILKNSDFVSISGSKIVTGQDFSSELTGSFFDKPEYFTFKFRGIKDIPESLTPYYYYRLNREFFNANKIKLPPLQKFSYYKEGINIYDESQNLDKIKIPQQIKTVNISAITHTQYKNERSLDLQNSTETPTVAFSSPCPPRWDEH